MSQLSKSELTTWLNDHGDTLYGYALIRVRSRTVAEDLVQETLLAGSQAYQSFSGQSSVNTWLTGILKHKIIDYFRKNSHESISLDDPEIAENLLAYHFDHNGSWKISLVEWTTPDQTLHEEQFWQVFHECLSRLPEAMANLFMLRIVDGIASEECCKILNIATTNQLCVALSRTRMKLRLCLETHWFDKE